MSTLSVRRVERVQLDELELRSRIERLAALHGLRPRTADGASLAFERGDLLGELFSSDVRRMPTRLTVVFDASKPGLNETRMTLEARTRFDLFTAGDRAALEGEMHALAAALPD